MNASDLFVHILAQGIAGDGAVPGGDPAGTTGTPGGGGGGGGLGPIIWLIPLMIAFMIFSSVMSGRKEKKKRAEMMSNLTKNAKVQTVGGVIGTIVELKNDEIVLKVDESGSTRIRFARSAIQQVLKPGKGGSDDLPEIEEISLEQER